MHPDSNPSIISKVKHSVTLLEQGKLSENDARNLINEVRRTITTNPDLAKELGALIPLINHSLRQLQSAPELTWIPVNEGYLAIGHKPGGKIPYKGMKMAGISVVLTLLNENEGAIQIGEALKKEQIEWIWLPFSASNPHSGKHADQVLDVFDKLKLNLKEGKKIYIHCSAGIHRTGMVTYAFLRYLGQNSESAIENLHKLRKITAEGATEERLKWGDQFEKE